MCRDRRVARQMGERGAKKLFDRGFESIEELKARCIAETGSSRRGSHSSPSGP